MVLVCYVIHNFMSFLPPPPSSAVNLIDREALRLEAVTVCMGFDDILDETLKLNMPQLDTMIVVTSHEDNKTQAVARKHGALLAITDLHQKNGRNFNKGAAINAGFNYFQYHGWRMHIDADIAFPNNFRRLLFNHHSLDRDCIYGADRVDVIGMKELEVASATQQHQHGCIVHSRLQRPVGARFVDNLHGYVPLGYFQLWHCTCQQPYPYSLGTAAHDDVMFAVRWPESQRRLLPGFFVHHIAEREPRWSENWDGHRRQPRLKK